MTSSVPDHFDNQFYIGHYQSVCLVLAQRSVCLSFFQQVNDIIFFLAIFLVFLFAYGAAAQAMLYPNHPLNADLIKKIVFYPYWQVFGELTLEEVEGETGKLEHKLSRE